ncbi:MAG: protein-glutamate O-methyltransferase CheR [Planctomycetales bacterium]|nr:protein-glutamate O-methyltransferase CheR [Planctomycetales bacterium]
MQHIATPEDMVAVCDLVYELCGVQIATNKNYLVESRLADLVAELQCGSYSALAEKARSVMHQDLRAEIIDRMTTHETLFFRDTAPFEALKNKVFPELIDSKERTASPRTLRIWSAACSTGQEPYSIAITLHELLGSFKGWDISILATDVSELAIQSASEGIYSAHQVERGLPLNLRNKYFEQCDRGWRISDSLRSPIRFRRFNLLESFTGLGTFDVILCRNVAIYFTSENRQDLFSRMAKTLHNDGYLFVGSAESLNDHSSLFRMEQHCRATVYRPVAARVFMCQT